MKKKSGETPISNTRRKPQTQILQHSRKIFKIPFLGLFRERSSSSPTYSERNCSRTLHTSSFRFFFQFFCHGVPPQLQTSLSSSGGITSRFFLIASLKLACKFLQILFLQKKTLLNFRQKFIHRFFKNFCLWDEERVLFES